MKNNELTTKQIDVMLYDLQENFLNWFRHYCPKSYAEVAQKYKQRPITSQHWMEAVWQAKRLEITEEFIEKVRKAMVKMLKKNGESIYDFTLIKHSEKKYNFFCFKEGSEKRELGAKL